MLHLVQTQPGIRAGAAHEPWPCEGCRSVKQDNPRLASVGLSRLYAQLAEERPLKGPGDLRAC